MPSNEVVAYKAIEKTNQAPANPGNAMVVYMPPKETAQALANLSNENMVPQITEERTPLPAIPGKRDIFSSPGKRRREEANTKKHDKVSDEATFTTPKRLYTRPDGFSGHSAALSSLALMPSDTAPPRRKLRISPTSSRSLTGLRTRPPVESPDSQSDSVSNDSASKMTKPSPNLPKNFNQIHPTSDAYWR